MALLRNETGLVYDFDKDMAFKLLSELYVTVDNKPLDQSEFTLDGKYIDYNGDLYLSPSIVNKITSLEIPGFVLREVRGSFNCRLAINLRSLKGAPKKIGRNFECALCDNLESLEGAPEWVGNNFNCSSCARLKSLEGAPKVVEGRFMCQFCCSLVSLEGAPEEVNADFLCSSCTNITSLKGSPRRVKGDFICSRCGNLKTLEGAPEIISNRFICYNNNLPLNEGIKSLVIGECIISRF